jgi:ribosome maturation factor RimP
MATINETGLVERITELGERAIAGTSIEIVDIELRGAGKSRLLRVYIDKAGGVTHADCELVSERLGGLLDQEDAVPGDSYTLEVSSPGLERKLAKPRDFERALGQKVRLTLREPVAGQSHFVGRLAAFRDGVIELDAPPGELVRVPLEQVRKANLKFDW